MKISRETIGFVLRYSALGLLLSVLIYYPERGIDAVSAGLLFLAIYFLISSLFWKKLPH